jgi:type II secretory ATPase GspE/PulE/Tfp pilus assembly ATPase PilB-like protein
VGIFECLLINRKQKASILNQAASFTIKKKAIEQGMTTMFEDGLSKMKAGITTLEEVMRTIKK